MSPIALSDAAFEALGAVAWAAAPHATLASNKASARERARSGKNVRIMSERAGTGQGNLFEASGVTEQEVPARALYVVALPIGNAGDITVRALWLLSRMDAIAAEDTRVTAPLLARFGIATPLVAAHQHNEREAAQAILERLARGERVALVSDAGTPGVSDPGARVVRAALDAGYRVVPVPGASSAVAAVSAAGLAPGPFRFIGFLPTGRVERERQLRALAADGTPFVLFEAPHRIRELLALLATAIAGSRRVVLARELTKKFETIGAYEASELASLAAEERGEYVVLVDAGDDTAPDVDAVTRRWLDALAQELPPARAAAVAARVSGQPRDVLYRLAMQLKAPR
jgi:16S rRNA (cytidine1402-2'-O)-methyltransferase